MVEIFVFVLVVCAAMVLGGVFKILSGVSISFPSRRRSK